MNITGKTVEGGNIICLPQNPKIDTAIIFRLQCLLNTYREQLILHLYPVRDYLHFRKNAVVGNSGEVVTLLDPGIEQKFVVAECDVNLYFALSNMGRLYDDNIYVEIVPLPGRYKLCKYKTVCNHEI